MIRKYFSYVWVHSTQSSETGDRYKKCKKKDVRCMIDTNLRWGQKMVNSVLNIKYSITLQLKNCNQIKNTLVPYLIILHILYISM